jgi:hypothetical protein
MMQIMITSFFFSLLAMGVAMLPLKIHAAYLTNTEIKAKATELLRSPEKIMELYVEYKNSRGSGIPSDLDRLLTSIHVDTLAAHSSNHSTRHVIQILSDDQVSFVLIFILILDFSRAGLTSATMIPPSSPRPLISLLDKESNSPIFILT